MQFDAFCRAHGLIVDSLISGRWVRVPTVDHPRKKNGAYKFLGDIGWAQNHATNVDVSTWRPDADAPKIDTQAIANKAAEFERVFDAGYGVVLVPTPAVWRVEVNPNVNLSGRFWCAQLFSPA